MAHAQAAKRSIHLMNLDPAAEHFDYAPSIDIRDLISLEEVMEDLELGPNGGLIYCFECAGRARTGAEAARYLLDNLDWLMEAMGDFEDD